jgi:hypothetical protein
MSSRPFESVVVQYSAPAVLPSGVAQTSYWMKYCWPGTVVMVWYRDEKLPASATEMTPSRPS